MTLYEVNYFKSSGQFKVNKFVDYSKVITETCDYISSSINNDSPYVIIVTTFNKTYSIQIDELEKTLGELIHKAYVSIELVKPDSSVEKTITIYFTNDEDEWNNGGLQECGSCFDTCRCCDSDD